MKQELQYKEKGVETLQEWVTCMCTWEHFLVISFILTHFIPGRVMFKSLNTLTFMLLFMLIIFWSQTSEFFFSLRIPYSFKWKYLESKTLFI